MARSFAGIRLFVVSSDIHNNMQVLASCSLSSRTELLGSLSSGSQKSVASALTLVTLESTLATPVS